MKYVLPAFMAVTCALTACKTTANRYDLYSANRAYGPYTTELRQWTLAGRDNHQSATTTYAVNTAPLPPTAADSGPTAPPPPMPPPTGLPETNSGAPAATPMPQAMPQAMPAAPIVHPAPAPVTPAATPAAPLDGAGGGTSGGSGPLIPGLSN